MWTIGAGKGEMVRMMLEQWQPTAQPLKRGEDFHLPLEDTGALGKCCPRDIYT